jgi:mercuric ion transport protein
MTDRAAIRMGMVGTVLAAICCAAPIVTVSLPLVGLGAWLRGAGLVALSLIVAGLGLVAWRIYRRHAKAASCEPKLHKEGVKP